MLVVSLKNVDGSEVVSFFVDIVEGEIRVRSGAVWDEEKKRYVERQFDTVTQRLKP